MERAPIVRHAAQSKRPVLDFLTFRNCRRTERKAQTRSYCNSITAQWSSLLLESCVHRG